MIIELGPLLESFPFLSFTYTYKDDIRSVIQFQMHGMWYSTKLLHTIALERIQRHATKFVLSDHCSDYKSRLLKLKLFPLMAWFEYIDIMFFITSLHHRSDRFDILRYVTITSHCTRSSDKVSLQHTLSKSCLSRHFFFNCLPRLWNTLPFIDIDKTISSVRCEVKRILWSNSVNNFKSDDSCSYHYCCPCNKCIQRYCCPCNKCIQRLKLTYAFMSI